MKVEYLDGKVSDEKVKELFDSFEMDKAEQGYFYATRDTFKKMKEGYESGGEIWYFDNKQWACLSGRSGYVLVKDGKPTDVYLIVGLN